MLRNLGRSYSSDMNMQIIIPMSGVGQRFVNEGYKTIKPLIEVESKPIIQHVIERFSPNDRYVFICNEDHLKSTTLEDTLLSLVPDAKIVAIKKHQLGPVHAVYQAYDYIKDDMPTIVNYCDFSWRWDYESFKKKVVNNKCDGSVIAYKDFHPHLLYENFYASVSENKRWMKEIREKFSFTKNKMDCFQSSGTYYFKNGHYVKKYFQLALTNGVTTNKEYYVSMVYNGLVNDGLKVYVYQIPFFLQWGTPDDLEEYLYWSDYFLDNNQNVT